MVHPDQLEKRFGGNREQPANKWPPYVGLEFEPAHIAKKQGHLYEGDEEYKKCLLDNPLLHVHPEFMKSE